MGKDVYRLNDHRQLDKPLPKSIRTNAEVTKMHSKLRQIHAPTMKLINTDP